MVYRHHLEPIFVRVYLNWLEKLAGMLCPAYARISVLVGLLRYTEFPLH